MNAHPCSPCFISLAAEESLGFHQHRHAAVRLVWAWMAVGQQMKSCSKQVVFCGSSPACCGKDLSVTLNRESCKCGSSGKVPCRQCHLSALGGRLVGQHMHSRAASHGEHKDFSCSCVLWLISTV